MTLKNDLDNMLQAARQAAIKLALKTTDQKQNALAVLGKAIIKQKKDIQTANQMDVKKGQEAGLSSALIDRLTLDDQRIEGMAESVRHVISLPDPVGEIFDEQTRPNGLLVARMRIPLGVIGIVFESRPNVVVDAAALCLKSGNGVILRGGKEAKNSNIILGRIIQQALKESDLPPAAVQVIKETDRELVLQLLRSRGLVDLVIPRGGEGLIRFVDRNATVPIILHYKGVCHVYVDKEANLEKALPIVENAKVQRPGVCNALETLLVHKDAAERFLPVVAKQLMEKGCQVRGCEKSRAILPDMKKATEVDWEAEYLDLVLAVRVVENYDQAVLHINRYGSDHSEAIITENHATAQRFLREINSSCVLVNASTRFNDGGELGLGAEIGISTTKLHAFGPMGLRELTTSKFIVQGNGQIRT